MNGDYDTVDLNIENRRYDLIYNPVWMSLKINGVWIGKCIINQKIYNMCCNYMKKIRKKKRYIDWSKKYIYKLAKKVTSKFF